jgi:hypothetical protein
MNPQALEKALGRAKQGSFALMRKCGRKTAICVGFGIRFVTRFPIRSTHCPEIASFPMSRQIVAPTCSEAAYFATGSWVPANRHSLAVNLFRVFGAEMNDPIHKVCSGCFDALTVAAAMAEARFRLLNPRPECLLSIAV